MHCTDKTDFQNFSQWTLDLRYLPKVGNEKYMGKQSLHDSISYIVLITFRIANFRITDVQHSFPAKRFKILTYSAGDVIVGGILHEYVCLGRDSVGIRRDGYARVDAGQRVVHALDPQGVVSQHLQPRQWTASSQKCVAF